VSRSSPSRSISSQHLSPALRKTPGAVVLLEWHRSETPASEGAAIPTKHPRIPITKDHALADALDTVTPYFPDKKPATLVHDLALKGAQAVLDEQQVRKEALERLAEWSTGRDDSLDWELLERIDDVAWGNK
jgi:hypothetical protein